LIYVAITDNLRLLIRDGDMVFFAQMVAPGRPVRADRKPDYPFLSILAFMVFLGVMFGLLMATAAPPPINGTVELPPNMARVFLQPTPPEPSEVKEEKVAEVQKAAPDKEGKAGTEDGLLPKSRAASAAKDQRDRKIVQQAGLLGVWDEMGQTSGFGNSGLDPSLVNLFGGLHGPFGAQIGVAGFSDRGDGLGGGGDDTIAKLRVGTRDGTCADCGTIERSLGRPVEVPNEPLVVGSLPRSVVDEVVKSHLNAIRYCYRRELPKEPSLAGKLVTRFVIASDGTVSSADPQAARSTLRHAGVENCVMRRFMRMSFPEPMGGGIVVVSYPFLFAPS
jgi:hypothetical protein